MSENTEQHGNKKEKDWSYVDSLYDAHAPTPPLSTPGELVPTPKSDLLPTPTTENLAVSNPVILPPPDIASAGWLGKWQAQGLSKKAALEQLQIQYNGQLEILKETVSQAVIVHKTKIGVAAEEYLKILDSKHLELLTKLGMRNAATRWKAVTDLTDMAVAQINEVEGKKWPKHMIEDTIKKIFSVRERVANEIMKELGSEHSSDK